MAKGANIVHRGIIKQNGLLSRFLFSERSPVRGAGGISISTITGKRANGNVFNLSKTNADGGNLVVFNNLVPYNSEANS
jgi:hypothetical protein